MKQDQPVVDRLRNESGSGEYEPPTVRVMTESEVLSAFQVTAAGSATWWAM